MKKSDTKTESGFNTQIISDYIKKNNLTQKDFCNKCNISINTYKKIITGKNFRLLSLYKIAKVINIPFHNFLK